MSVQRSVEAPVTREEFEALREVLSALLEHLHLSRDVVLMEARQAKVADAAKQAKAAQAAAEWAEETRLNTLAQDFGYGRIGAEEYEREKEKVLDARQARKRAA